MAKKEKTIVMNMLERTYNGIGKGQTTEIDTNLVPMYIEFGFEVVRTSTTENDIVGTAEAKKAEEAAKKAEAEAFAEAEALEEAERLAAEEAAKK